MEQSIQRQVGVEKIKTDWKAGITELTVRKGTPLDMAKVAKAVRDTPLTLRSIEMTATGRVVDGQDTRLAFKIKGSDEQFWLVNNEQVRKLTSIPGVRQREVTVTGKLVESQKSPLGLAVESYRISETH